MNPRGGVAGRKLTLGVLAFFMVPGAVAAQAPLERTAGLQVVDQPLEAALRRLQQTAGVALVFSPDLLPGSLRVSCACARVTVAQALERMLQGSGLDFVASGTLVTIVPARSESSTPAPGAIAGWVVNDVDGAPVVNALVRLDDGRSILTGRNGSFFFREIRPGIHSVQVSALGWRQRSVEEAEVPEGSEAQVRIVLARDVIPLPQLLIQPGTFGLLDEVPRGAAQALTRGEIRTRPQLGEDVFRAMKGLPGVTSNDISARLILRGGGAREVLVRLDGLELYEPYHVKDWEGALGIVDINVLGEVELLTGGFGAQHGGHMTGVMDMRSLRPEGDPKTTLGLSVSNATATSRGLFGQGKGQWLLSARRGFLDLVMEVANEGRRLSPAYHDVFGKVGYDFGTAHRVTARFLLAGDRFRLRDPEVADLDTVDFRSEWTSRYGWVTWEAYPGSRLSLNTVAWIGDLTRRRGGFLEDASDTPFRIAASDRRGFSFAGLRSELGAHVANRVFLRIGAEGRRLRADYDYLHRTWSPYVTAQNTRGVREDTLAVVLDPSGHELNAYAALRIRAADRWTAEAGLRYDQVSHTGDRDLAPRFLAAYDLSARTHLRASLGRYEQSQGLPELWVGDGEAEYSASEDAWQVAVGADHRVSSGLGVRLELYRRTIAHPRPEYLNVEQEVKIFPEASGDRLRIDPDRGLATGLELLIEGESGPRWAWSASYVLAKAEDRVEGSWIPRRFDQRHTVALQAAFQPDPRWNLSLGWRFHTGWPATAWSWDVHTLDDGWNLWNQEFGPLRRLRLPPYHRLDLRVTRSFQVARGRLQLYLDLFNVYDRTNLGSWDFSGTYRDGALSVQRLNGQEMLPILPTLGLWWEF